MMKLVLGLVFSICLIMGTSGALGQSWSTPELLTTAPQNKGYPQVFDANEDWHLVYKGYNSWGPMGDSSTSFIMYKTRDGETVIAGDTIFNDSSNSVTSPSLSLAPDGTISVMYVEEYGWGISLLMHRVYDGSTWSEPAIITYTAPLWPTHVIDASGNWHVVGEIHDTDTTVVYFNSLDSTSEIPFVARYDPFVDISPAGTLRIRYREASYPHNLYCRIYNNESWSDEIYVTTIENDPDCGLVFDSSDNWHVAYTYDAQDRITYKNSSGEFDIVNGSHIDKPTLSWSPNGILHMLYINSADSNYYVWHTFYPDDCCGKYTGGYTGNTDCNPDGKRNLADITRLIDRVYLSKAALCCEANGNVDGDIDSKMNLADITRLIDKVYLSKAETEQCD